MLQSPFFNTKKNTKLTENYDFAKCTGLLLSIMLVMELYLFIECY